MSEKRYKRIEQEVMRSLVEHFNEQSIELLSPITSEMFEGILDGDWKEGKEKLEKASELIEIIQNGKKGRYVSNMSTRSFERSDLWHDFLFYSEKLARHGINYTEANEWASECIIDKLGEKAAKKELTKFVKERIILANNKIQ